MTNAQGWYIVKAQDESCQIITHEQFAAIANAQPQHWGPFASQSEAIARRVGLIRAGKCQPQ
ncbi:DDE transposase family protein [Almyronema epifaneia]|uniref:DDE transposase family protein n=1 Tax=Almyronema epifaneia S1 TaxID=2991925 RepID=A0ABW6IBV3_9CYAN